ncbi:hypothetical protein [Oryza sativa Japonica Group]|uniref:Uncharacterized protein n=1 Tax=Oryza sativa subsp. japonica TaxID=39947 RepID=Q5JM76_ORYSJ|nr:hypothetical protein [Oryza sativa Japonica Group]
MATAQEKAVRESPVGAIRRQPSPVYLPGSRRLICELEDIDYIKSSTNLAVRSMISSQM